MLGSCLQKFSIELESINFKSCTEVSNRAGINRVFHWKPKKPMLTCANLYGKSCISRSVNKSINVFSFQYAWTAMQLQNVKLVFYMHTLLRWHGDVFRGELPLRWPIWNLQISGLTVKPNCYQIRDFTKYAVVNYAFWKSNKLDSGLVLASKHYFEELRLAISGELKNSLQNVTLPFARAPTQPTTTGKGGPVRCNISRGRHRRRRDEESRTSKAIRLNHTSQHAHPSTAETKRHGLQ